MKGEALITVRDKNGNIKTQVREKNTVFDLPKEIIKLLIANANLGPLGGNTYSTPGNQTVSPTLSSPFACITAYAEWFRCLKVNDVECSTTDFKDWKYPVLMGGEYTAQNTANKRYAYIDTTKMQKSGKIMKKYYSWMDCPAFTLRSLNLCHYSQGGQFGHAYSIFTYQREASSNDPNYLRNKGKYYYSGCLTKHSVDYWGSDYYNTLSVINADGFTWDGQYSSNPTNDQGCVNFDTLYCCYMYFSAGSMTWRTPQIFALKDGIDENDQPVKELAVFRNSNDMTTNDTDHYWKYIKILNADTGVERRSFLYAKFSGITSSSNGVYITSSQCCNIVATDFGTFLIQSTGISSGSTVKIWKIPETQTDETIPVYATVSETSFRPEANMIVINEYVFDAYHGKAIKINNDSNDPYTFYDYLPFNYPSEALQNGSYKNMANFSKYYDIVKCRSYNFETWYNTTVLNLSTPIQVAAGDTLSIEYTITVS